MYKLGSRRRLRDLMWNRWYCIGYTSRRNGVVGSTKI